MGKFVPLKCYGLIKENASNTLTHQDDILDSWISSVISYIDEKIKELKNELATGKTQKQKNSYFSKLKNWWYNATMGSKNNKNPFYFQNYLGNLGKVVEMNLEDYQFITNEAIILEDITNRPKLHMDNLIDNWSDKFKKELSARLRKIFTKAIQTAPPRPNNVNKKTNPIVSTIYAPEFHDEEEKMDLTEKPQPISDIYNIIRTLESDDAVDDEQYFAHIFQSRFYEKAKNNPTMADEILKELKDYMDNRLPENLNLLLSKLNKKYAPSVKMTESLFDDFFLQKTELNFGNSTLYDRTIECLDKLREKK